MSRYLINTVIALLLVSAVFAQRNDRELSSIIATANKAFENHNFYGAGKLYEQALEHNSRMYDIVWKAAEAYRLDNDYLRAAYFYKILVDNELNNYPEALFYLAKMEKSNEEYIRAQYFFNKFYRENKEDSTNLLVKRAKREIEYCEYAWNLMSNPGGEIIETFDTTINTIYSEFAPFMLGDSILYFSSIRPETDTCNRYRSKIYKSRLIDSIFTTAIPLDTIINIPGYDVANPFLTKDGSRLYFSAMKADYQSESHIYRSLRDGNIWTKPELLPEKINVKGYNSIHPSIAERHNNTDVLLWSSDRPEGEGGYDIYYCEILPDGSFGYVRNLGRPILDGRRFREFYDTTSTINTVGNEISPFYNVNDSLLYFSSDWINGMGGFDIFSVKGNFRVWDSLQNLGYPINTAQNDFYYKVFDESRYVVFTSNRKGSLALSHQSCCNDLYYYKLDEIIDEQEIEDQRIELITERARLLVPIELYFHNDRPVPRSWDTVTTINYTDSYFDYIARIEEFRENYTRGIRRNQQQAALDSINNFFAEYVEANYNKLLEFSELLKQLMQENQKVEITIMGFTSPLNTAEYNINLSKRRISSLVNYFNEYDDGYFLPFIETGQMKLDFAAFGESLADAAVSADPTDRRSSVYSPAASRERRIEIIAVAIEDERNNTEE